MVYSQSVTYWNEEDPDGEYTEGVPTNGPTDLKYMVTDKFLT